MKYVPGARWILPCAVCSGKCVGEALGGPRGEKAGASSCTHMVRPSPFVWISGVL